MDRSTGWDGELDFRVLGTIEARQIPLVFLTSNNTRELSEALKRRCLFLHIDYPYLEREKEIVLTKVPDISDSLADQVARIVRAQLAGAEVDGPVAEVEQPRVGVELVVRDGRATYRHWQQGPIPAEHALRGFFGATLWVGEAQGTADLLTRSPSKISQS